MDIDIGYILQQQREEVQSHMNCSICLGCDESFPDDTIIDVGGYKYYCEECYHKLQER